MSEKGERFRKLEFTPLLKVFKKSKPELTRFEHLEVDGHRIDVEAVHKGPAEAEKFIDCPKCGKRNPPECLYCLYCSFVFNSVASEVPDSGLQPYQIKCPQCSRIGVRSQSSCLYCGFTFAPPAGDGIPVGGGYDGHKVVDLREGPAITVRIDGIEYRSLDPDLPDDIRELMIKIRHEGYSKKMVDAWVANRNAERELEWAQVQKQYRDAQRQFWMRIAQFTGVIAFFLFILILASRR